MPGMLSTGTTVHVAKANLALYSQHQAVCTHISTQQLPGLSWLEASPPSVLMATPKTQPLQVPSFLLRVTFGPR